jgi:hypothetical protein
MLSAQQLHVPKLVRYLAAQALLYRLAGTLHNAT